MHFPVLNSPPPIKPSSPAVTPTLPQVKFNEEKYLNEVNKLAIRSRDNDVASACADIIAELSAVAPKDKQVNLNTALTNIDQMLKGYIANAQKNAEAYTKDATHLPELVMSIHKLAMSAQVVENWLKSAGVFMSSKEKLELQDLNLTSLIKRFSNSKVVVTSRLPENVQVETTSETHFDKITAYVKKSYQNGQAEFAIGGYSPKLAYYAVAAAFLEKNVRQLLDSPMDLCDAYYIMQATGLLAK